MEQEASPAGVLCSRQQDSNNVEKGKRVSRQQKFSSQELLQGSCLTNSSHHSEVCNKHSFSSTGLHAGWNCSTLGFIQVCTRCPSVYPSGPGAPVVSKKGATNYTTRAVTQEDCSVRRDLHVPLSENPRPLQLFLSLTLNPLMIDRSRASFRYKHPFPASHCGTS